MENDRWEIDIIKDKRKVSNGHEFVFIKFILFSITKLSQVNVFLH